jgi:hypothetical protein
MKSNGIILSILRTLYAKITLGKKVNWMTMRVSSTSKIIIPTLPDIPRERKFINKELERMMDHVVITTEVVEWSATSSDDDQTRCLLEGRREKEIAIKCTWLDNTLLNMALQDQYQGRKLHEDIAMEYQEQDSFVFSPPTEVIQQEPHSQDNVEYILRLEEELGKTRATIEECTKYIENIQSQFLAKDELIN